MCMAKVSISRPMRPLLAEMAIKSRGNSLDIRLFRRFWRFFALQASEIRQLRDPPIGGRRSEG